MRNNKDKIKKDKPNDTRKKNNINKHKIESTNSKSKQINKKQPKHKHIIEIILAVVVIICIAIGVSIISFNHEKKYYANHVKNHLSSISYNAPELGHKKFNGKYNMIFYEDDCPHCQKIIPKIYVKNKMHLRHVQYHDLMPKTADYNSEELGSKMNVNTVPTEVHVVAHHGHIVHYHKLAKLY